MVTTFSVTVTGALSVTGAPSVTVTHTPVSVTLLLPDHPALLMLADTQHPSEEKVWL